MVDPEQVNEEDRLAIQQQKKSIYQVRRGVFMLSSVWFEGSER